MRTIQLLARPSSSALPAESAAPSGGAPCARRRRNPSCALLPERACARAGPAASRAGDGPAQDAGQAAPPMRKCWRRGGLRQTAPSLSPGSSTRAPCAAATIKCSAAALLSGPTELFNDGHAGANGGAHAAACGAREVSRGGSIGGAASGGKEVRDGVDTTTVAVTAPRSSARVDAGVAAPLRRSHCGSRCGEGRVRATARQSPSAAERGSATWEVTLRAAAERVARRRSSSTSSTKMRR